MSIHTAYKVCPELKEIDDRILEIVEFCESGVPPGIDDVDPGWREAVMLSCNDPDSPLRACPLGAPLQWIVSEYNRCVPAERRLSQALVKKRIDALVGWGELILNPEQSAAHWTDVYRLGPKARSKSVSADPMLSNIGPRDGSQGGGPGAFARLFESVTAQIIATIVGFVILAIAYWKWPWIKELLG